MRLRKDGFFKIKFDYFPVKVCACVSSLTSICLFPFTSCLHHLINYIALLKFDCSCGGFLSLLLNQKCVQDMGLI
uniref:Uncharacterized protein n=1 Tax=Rhizophora mucronata TaxID=61149 RepID=A0A2P2KGY1_RHIMU